MSESPSEIINFLARRMEPLRKVEDHLTKLEEKILLEPMDTMSVETALSRYVTLSKLVLNHIDTLSKVMQKEDVESYMKGFGMIDIFLKLKSLPIESLEKIKRVIDGAF